MDDERSRDLYQLREVLSFSVTEEEFGGSEAISDSEQSAFENMLDELLLGQKVLTDRQRKWVIRVCERLGVNLDPPEQRKVVPIGKPVELSPVLRNLPKRPPGRS